jgi:pimeloyl-ACP methyl ester carboxylesterase
VLDRLGIDTPVDWLGNAWGGHVGAIAAATYPALVRSLVMVGTPVAALSAFERARTYLLLGLYSVRGPSATVVDGTTKVLLSAQTRAADPDAVRLVQDCLRTADRRMLRNAIVSVSLHRNDITASLRQVTQPALVITGAEHHGFTPAQAQEAAELLHNAQVAVVPGASYLVPLEAPDSVARLVGAFWAERDAAAAA